MSPSSSLLRLKVATNLFKKLLLKDLHIAGSAQVSTVFEALAASGCEEGLSERTWQSWFSKAAVLPKVDKAKVLDEFAAKAIRVLGPRGVGSVALPNQTFSTLIHGGLVRTLTAPSKAKKMLPVLVTRTLEYVPVSPLHLHLDAMEISALAEGTGDLPWTAVKWLGAERILDILAARWGPRQGTVYSEFSSDMALQWQAASEAERIEIRASCAHFQPDIFQHFMNATPTPDWRMTGIHADIPGIHIYKALFAIAADTSFLVADRLSAWSLDLATAALAMHALAWTDRYETFGPKVTEEMTYWSAFNALLFEENEPSFDQFDLLPAIALSQAEWCNGSRETFLLGRESYRDALTELGTSASEILSVAMQGPKALPLRYEVNRRS